MKVFTELEKNPDLSLALGYFDGVHSAHSTVIKKAVEFANENNKKSAVITFQNHPCCYLRGVCPKYILTSDMRREKIAQLGVDYLYTLDFESLSGLTAYDFLVNVLMHYFSPCAISTGWNYGFGYKKSGNAQFLHANSDKFDYEYFEIPPQKINGEIVSSTLIRKFLSNGRIEAANSMLGYNFCVKSDVVHGNEIGRTLGFKTANVAYPAELIDLASGVYEVDTNYGKGVANFGTRPTINGSSKVLEVHILNFDDDIYGKNITVEFKRMIRKEKKFASLNDLKNQIKRDILTVNQSVI